MSEDFDNLMKDDNDPVIPFGKHKGKYASDIDVKYLDWLIGRLNTAIGLLEGTKTTSQQMACNMIEIVIRSLEQKSVEDAQNLISMIDTAVAYLTSSDMRPASALDVLDSMRNILCDKLAIEPQKLNPQKPDSCNDCALRFSPDCQKPAQPEASEITLEQIHKETMAKIISLQSDLAEKEKEIANLRSQLIKAGGMEI